MGITEYGISGLLIYPNPAAGFVTIELPESGSQLIITDLLGNIVYSERKLNNGKNLLDLSKQAAGVYLVKVTSGTATSVSRLVIRK